VTPEVVAAWFTILARVPHSRLLVLAYRGGYLERSLHERARGLGIDPSRVELADKCSPIDFLRLIARADVALDPFPFNGHTTTCDSLWMGVPVVMLEGATYASRFGGTALMNLGLEDLIAHSVPEYIDRAAGLAGDLERLTELRTSLRARMAASVLLDHQGFTRHVEAAYRQMWLDWCADR
jgi:predicted O-linked N-acetylglucosamine transferase (SPINDLY family)